MASMDAVLNTPVVLTIFSRRDIVERVLAAIRKAGPKRLYVIGDAGRTPEESEKVKEVRFLIAEIDWCEVRTNYAEENMGPKKRLATGISWAFEQEERAIVLEHDCLPDPSFFPFCEELLERYKDDERVMHIGGNNFFSAVGARYECPDSYFFTHIPHIWGWATWRRAWKYYDVDVKRWPEARERNLLNNVFRDPAVAFRWSSRFQEYYEGKIESWDGQWSFAVLSQGGLCINPSVNLVSNIGFGKEAFSTKNVSARIAEVPTAALNFPLAHPEFLVADELAEHLTQKYVFHINETKMQRFKWFLKSALPFWYRLAKKVTLRKQDAL